MTDPMKPGRESLEMRLGCDVWMYFDSLLHEAPTAYLEAAIELLRAGQATFGIAHVIREFTGVGSIAEAPEDLERLWRFVMNARNASDMLDGYSPAGRPGGLGIAADYIERWRRCSECFRLAVFDGDVLPPACARCGGNP